MPRRTISFVRKIGEYRALPLHFHQPTGEVSTWNLSAFIGREKNPKKADKAAEEIIRFVAEIHGFGIKLAHSLGRFLIEYELIDR